MLASTVTKQFLIEKIRAVLILSGNRLLIFLLAYSMVFSRFVGQLFLLGVSEVLIVLYFTIIILTAGCFKITVKAFLKYFTLLLFCLSCTKHDFLN